MSKIVLRLAPIAAAILFTAPAAQAHGLIAEGNSWFAGFVHPLSGIDHLLAMLATGLWAAQQGGNRLWQLPVAFLVMVALGAFAGYQGFGLPVLETGVVGSLMVLGLMLALAVRLPLFPSLLTAGFFAMFHGYAHGMEIRDGSAVFEFVGGFLTTTAILLMAGIFSGLLLRSMNHGQLLRIGGLAIAATGGWLCL